MIDLSKPISSLSTENKSISVLSEINQIKDAIKKRSPDRILKNLEKNGQLSQYYDFYQSCKLADPRDVADKIKDKNCPIIEILIGLHCHNFGAGKPTTINWEEPHRDYEQCHTYKKADIAFLRHQNQKKPVKNPPKLISDFVNGLGRAPDGTPMPGVYNIHRTPYVIEPLNNMSPFSGIRNTAIMKPVQSGITFNCGEGTIKYYLAARPAKIMYMSGTDALLKKFLNLRFEPMIDSCGFRHLIRAQSLKKNNRSTGDTAEYKEFPGGTLILGSLQSEASMRQESVMVMIRDEISLVDAQMSSGEGNRLDVSDGRTIAYDESGRVKILDYSTPGLAGSCLIEMQYQKGDQRKYFLTCPLCGKRQYLEIGTEKSQHGLKGDYTAGRLTNAYYLCYHCHDALFNYQKEKLLKTGIWLPTTTGISDDFRSYHFNALYSPMVSWKTIREKYDTALDQGDDGMRGFTNLYMAEAFRPSGERPKWQTVIELRSGYNSGTVPPGIMFLTMFVDVQRGKDIWREWSDADMHAESIKLKKEGNHDRLKTMQRLEVEIIGHGHEFRTASIEYNIFYGKVEDETTGAWQRFADWMTETKLIFSRKDGFQFPVQIIGIDSGTFTDTVVRFCEGKPMTYATKGDKTKKEDKKSLAMVDSVRSPGMVGRVALSTKPGYPLLLIDTNYYKGQIYRKLKNLFKDHEDQPANSHQTPSDYQNWYFQGLTAEEQKTDGSFHNVAGRPNEPLDLMVGNLALSDFLIQGFIDRDKDQWKQRGITDPEILRQKVNRKIVMQRFEHDLRQEGW